MLVSEISTRVKKQFGDESGVQIDDSDVIRWVNDAMVEIALQNQLFQTMATADIALGQNTYSLPADILTMRSVQVNNVKVQYLNYNEAEVMVQADTTSTGTPEQFYTWANQLYLYPTPDATVVGGLKMFYTRKPATVALTTDTPELPIQYHNRLVEYCLQQAYELDENWQAAKTKGEQFAQGVMQLKDNVDWVERDFYPMITSTDLEGYYAW